MVKKTWLLCAVVQFLSMWHSSSISVNKSVSNTVLFLVNKELWCAGGSSISLNHMWLDHRTHTFAASPRNRYNQHHQFSNTTTVVDNQRWKKNSLKKSVSATN